ncbi:unnamed protein product [Parascedosporium putredinis]|uniref:AB hydrolase-1 domain-containing protein n=1 Tax=Parascedosporium putredinis TaxID=1442378 RepID=A0A9P1GUD5_9PEZI|nr:unnamed protein product [Parascedosporium putredinis]CAI7987286.1 unnamed protein product [Parascedosporium putredinis]
MADGLVFTLHNYSHEHELQRLATWEFPSSVVLGPAARWIVFIHGGAWRDPSNTYQDFLPTIEALLSSHPMLRPAIRGFASLDYRLSSHPNHAQDPSSTPADRLRCAKHPDHIRDICLALRYLDAKFNMRDRYILVGHSVGATLAFQLLMGDQATKGFTSPAAQPTEAGALPLPASILGIAGIYEFYDFAYRHGGPYIPMVEGALGPDHSKWNDAAPLKASLAGRWTGNDWHFYHTRPMIPWLMATAKPPPW